MGTVTFQNRAEMNNPSIWYGDVDYYDSNYIAIWEGLGGRGGIYVGKFKYSNGAVSGGTLTGYISASNVYSYSDYDIDYIAEGFSLSANTAYNLIQSGNAEGFQAWVLSENDTINGSAYSDYIKGYAGNDLILGNNGSDTLDGGAGNDTLIGGAGADSMVGGTGNDTYVVDNLGDTVTELDGEGTDTIQLALSSNVYVPYVLADFVENLTFTGTGPIALFGNGLANTITGSAGNDFINGGAGADTMIGGAGSDTYYVDNIGDVVTEAANGGTGDYVYSYLTTYTLGANVEHLGWDFINVGATSSNLTFTGNALQNYIFTSDGNDTITGLGGVDTLYGGHGSDLYIMTLAADHTAAEINDDGASGTDEVRFTSTTAGTLTLYAGDIGIETVVIGTGTGASAITTGTTANNVNAALVTNALSITGNNGKNTLTGTAYEDTLIGNAGNDMLIGGGGNDRLIGGVGADSLTGGLGSDTFVFIAGDTGQKDKTFDIIQDYTKGALGTGDLIDYASTLSVGGSNATATATQASINSSTGVASFAAGSGTKLADALADIATSFTAATNSPGEFAFFRVNNAGNFYMFISDGTAGLGANDVVIQLVGITSINGIDLNSGDLTIVS